MGRQPGDGPARNYEPQVTLARPWEPFVNDLLFILLTLFVFGALALCVKGVEKL